MQKRLRRFVKTLMRSLRRVKRLRAHTLWVVLWSALVAAAATALWVFFILRSLPSPDLLENRRVIESTKIYDRTGEILLYEIHGEEKRTVIPFGAMPGVIKQATIAIEDEDFYSHSAIDVSAILRAFLVNLRSGEVVQGGSTITQQLAKKAFLTDDRIISRKIKELALSVQLERKYSKDEILYFYLNQIPYGSNAYGIESASQVFFEKPASDLSLEEAALLASLPQAPSYYSPWGVHVPELMERKDTVLNRMYGLGFITEEDRDEAKAAELSFAKPSRGIRAPHFVIAVQEYLNDQYGEDFVRTGGLTVITTLDWDMQQVAERVVLEGAQRNTELYNGTNAALVAEDPKTGQILALVGSRDYFDTEREGNFNVATQGLRQPGSAIKPFIYAAAFRKGYTPNTVLFDLPTEFDTSGNPAKSYAPENFDGDFKGPITMRESLAQSVNITAVKTLYLVGLPTALDAARSFGLRTLTEISRYGLSLVLGGGEVRLIDIVGAYGTLANDGVKAEQSFILEVSTNEKTLEAYAPRASRVMEAEHVRLINDILSDSDARRPLYSSSFSLTTVPDRQVALKTGTTNDYRDAWTFGYTPDLAIGVWAGNNNNEPMQKQGSSILAALPMWHAFASEVIPQTPMSTFIKPSIGAVGKPVLNGSHVVEYEANGTIYPHIHSILFYVARNDPRGADPKIPESDPQFTNWEAPVHAWSTANVPGFVALYNKPLPEGSVVVGSGNTPLLSGATLTITSPAGGDFISSNLTISFSVESPIDIENVSILVNKKPLYLEQSSGITPPFSFTKTFDVSGFGLLPQNELEVSITDGDGEQTNAQVIFFK